MKIFHPLCKPSRSLAVVVIVTMAAACLWRPCLATDASQEDALVVAELKGLVLVNDPKVVAAGGVSDAQGVRITDLPVLNQPEFRESMADYLGKPLTKSGLAKIVKTIVVYYRKQGRPVVDVSAPPQDITSGALQILVLEGKVGQVRVEGNRWFKSESLSHQVRVKPGQALDAAAIAQDIDWINRNPFRRVDLVYVKGAELGLTDLVLREVDLFPLRFYTGYDDSGTSLTENDRYLLGMSWGKVFGGEGQANYQFKTSPDFISFRAHSGSFMQPLPWRHILTLFGSYADSKANLPDPLDLSGYNWQMSLRYEVPLPSMDSYRHALVGGFDFKQSNNNLTFGGNTVFTAATEVAQWSLGYNASRKDALGESSARATVFFSPGGFSSLDNNGAYQTSRADSKAHYIYGQLELNRTTKMPFDCTLVNLITLQAADANLLSSEQLGFGGYDTIRGYDQRVFNADSGYIISTELRSPGAAILARLPRLKALADRGQLLGFIDYGAGGNHIRLQGEKNEVKLLSVGPGLRYNVSTHVAFRLDYGWQLLNQAEAGRPYPSRAHLGLVMNF